MSMHMVKVKNLCHPYHQCQVKSHNHLVPEVIIDHPPVLNHLHLVGGQTGFP